MRRDPIAPRSNWRDDVEKLGLLFHTTDDGTSEGSPYWHESAYYTLNTLDVERLGSAGNELFARCLDAVQHVIETRSFSRLGIPEAAISAIERSWEDDVPSVYGRFDLAYDGKSAPKMLEFNADTPTSLLEAAVVQWHWVQAVFPGSNQFNSIWEALVDKWSALREEGVLPGDKVYFAHEELLEDLMTVSVLRDTAQEAGLAIPALHMEEIGWDTVRKRFVDLENRDIQTLFKLYPWEFMLKDSFGEYALRPDHGTQWIEPIWKMVLSNKGILPILWEMFPNHPNLLPAYSDGPREMAEFVRKPLLGREGANVTVVKDGHVTQNEGEYGEEGFVFQELGPIPNLRGFHPVIGAWIIDGETRGIGIRESTGLITDNFSRFTPHVFVDNA